MWMGGTWASSPVFQSTSQRVDPGGQCVNVAPYWTAVYKPRGSAHMQSSVPDRSCPTSG